MQENEQLNPEELQTPKLATLPVDPTALEQEEKIMEGVEDMSPEELEKVKAELQKLTDKLDADDLDKKNYVKISPTFYLQAVKTEELDEEGEKIELFKILNPVEGTVETRELTDDEKKELLVTELKRSRQRFNPFSHPTKTVGTEIVVSSIGRERKVKTKEYQTNVTKNQFDTAYKQKRKRRNKLAKASRKANR